MVLSEDMRAVIVRIQKLKIHPDLVSPNLVADISFKMNRNLTPEQIVYISDKFI